MIDWQNSIQTGDCFDVLADLPAESVHACVTDPPYGLAFMGRDWDDFEPKEYQEWCQEWAEAVKRVLKPGGHSWRALAASQGLGGALPGDVFTVRDYLESWADAAERGTTTLEMDTETEQLEALGYL